jgi:polar amino acid transport system substrate-binding protein
VEAMKKKVGVDAKITVYPWARAYMMALKQPNTFIFGIARTKEREQLFKWVGDYYKVTDTFFALASRRDIRLSAVEDAKNYKTAVPRGDIAALRLEKLGFNSKHLQYVTFQEQCVRLLHLGRVDLNSNNELGFFTQIRKLGFQPDEFRRVFVISEVPVGMAASQGTPDHLVQKMRNALSEIKADGTHAGLLRKWFPSQH